MDYIFFLSIVRRRREALSEVYCWVAKFLWTKEGGVGVVLLPHARLMQY